MVNLEIIKLLKEKHPNLKLSQVKTIFELIFQELVDNLIKEKSIELRGFGRWSVKILKARYNARNPKNNEIIFVPQRKKISFKMSKELKYKINNLL